MEGQKALKHRTTVSVFSRAVGTALLLGRLCALSLVLADAEGAAEEKSNPELHEAGVVRSQSRGVTAELSPAKVRDGGLVRVSVWVPSQGPESDPARPWSGSYEGVVFPLLEVKSGSEGRVAAQSPSPVPSPTSTGTELVKSQTALTKMILMEGYFGVPHSHAPGRVRVRLAPVSSNRLLASRAEEGLQLDFEIVDGKYPAETLSVEEKHVKPSRQVMKRIEAEQREVGKIYRKLTAQKYWSGAFSLPIESAVTSPFGTKRLFNGAMKSFHKGLDLRAAVGTPVVAPAGGKVVLAKDLYFTGNTVLLDHGYGFVTLYAHLQEIKVKNGQEVGKGTLLGLSGSTGRVSGPHLHWGAIIHRTKVDPRDLLTVLR
jgi:murein DD-endopeptidase MepM/ murein hydrolase activator NlpD